MFDRKSIKEFARYRLRQGRWMAILVVIVAGLLGAAVPTPSLPSFNVSGNLPAEEIISSDDSGDTGTVWDDALPYEEGDTDAQETDPDAADPGIWEDAGGESGFPQSWEDFKSWFARPSLAWGVGIFIGIFAVVFLFVFLMTLLETIFLGNIATVGLNGWMLRFWRNERLSLLRLFDAFRIYKPSLMAMLVRDVYTFLWSLLFFVPGIVKSYAYAMVPYVIYENPNLTPNQAIALSERLTRGYKWKLFVLDLSFIWWNLLSVVTLGIAGVVYVTPYKCLTYAGAYEQLKWAALQEGRADWSDFGQVPPAELWDTPAADPIVAEPIPADEMPTPEEDV